MTNRQQRLKQVFEHLRNHFNIHTQGDFADAIGYSRPVVSSALNGNVDKITDKMLRTITKCFPGIFDIEYLLTGDGQLLTAEEDVAKKSTDERLGRNQQPQPAPASEVPDEVRLLIDHALLVSKRNEELVDRLAHAISDNRQNAILLQGMAENIKREKEKNDRFMLEIKTAAESINSFRMQIDKMRQENESLKASNEKLGKRLDKAAELFKELNSRASFILDHPNAAYGTPEPEIHSANEP